MSMEKIPDSQEVGVAGFITKTFEILNNEEYAKIIHWGPTGKDFVIKDINKFQDIVLPHFFRHKKMNSFVRQLNMYGFHKSRKDNSKCIFSHPCFLKDREDLLITIKRKIKDIEAAIKTPIKESQPECLKPIDNTCLKETDEKKHVEEAPILTGFLESRNRLNSFINLSMSLKKLSANNLDLLEGNLEDDNVSIINGMDDEEKQKDKQNILNPSFFFRSFNSVTFN